MKRLTSLLAFVALLGACGAEARSDSGSPESGGEPVAGMVRIVCEKDGARTLDPRTRAHRDGAHVLFLNRSGADEFYMRTAADPDENHGGFLRGKQQMDLAPHTPGEMWVGCFGRGDHPPYYEFDDRYAVFEIVDVNDLWIPWKLSCEDSTQIKNKRVSGAETQGDVLEWFRDRFDLPPGPFSRPGYPKTAHKGNPWVLHIDGETIANVHPWKENGVWTISTGAACTD